MAVAGDRKRAYTPREGRLVTEYLWDKYRQYPQWKRVRLGTVPNTAMAKLYTVSLRWADAIVFTGEEIVILEGKMGPELGGIAQLEEYRNLFPRTPEFSMYSGYPIRCVYLTTKESRDVKRICDEKGFDFVVFTPPWVAEYWRERGFDIPES